MHPCLCVISGASLDKYSQKRNEAPAEPHPHNLLVRLELKSMLLLAKLHRKLKNKIIGKLFSF